MSAFVQCRFTCTIGYIYLTGLRRLWTRFWTPSVPAVGRRWPRIFSVVVCTGSSSGRTCQKPGTSPGLGMAFLVGSGLETALKSVFLSEARAHSHENATIIRSKKHIFQWCFVAKADQKCHFEVYLFRSIIGCVLSAVAFVDFAGFRFCVSIVIVCGWASFTREKKYQNCDKVAKTDPPSLPANTGWYSGVL